MKNLLRSLRNAGAIFACSALQCSGKHGSRSDDDVRARHMGQWPHWSRSWNTDWDCRQPDPSHTPDKRAYKTRRLILIRHGQYDLNTSDHGLTALGREQAAITAQRIAELAASDAAVSDHYGRRPVRLLRVVHSDVTRAAETAAIISKALPPNVAVEVDTLLAEGYPCIPEPAGRVEPCASAVYEESARIEAAFRKYCHRVTDHKAKSSKLDTSQANALAAAESGDDASEEYIVLVCHQNVIRYFACRALQLPPEAWLRFRGNNCGVTEIIISDDGRASLDKFADVGHLPLRMHTFH